MFKPEGREFDEASWVSPLRGSSPRIAQPLPCYSCPVRQSALCGALAIEGLGALASSVRQTNYERHQTICYEGDEAETVFLVNSGIAMVSSQLADGRRQISEFFYPADFFGYPVNPYYTSSVTAVTPLTLCRIRRVQFEALLEEYPCLESALHQQVRRDLVAAQDLILLLGKKSAAERVSSFILMLSARAHRLAQPDNPLWVPMTRDDIGDYLGLTTETVSRALSRLENLGAIAKLPNGKIGLKDRAKLQDISERA